MFDFLPHSFLQMNAIFISILIEALPFVLLGCLISGLIHSFLTVDVVKKYLPQNKFLSICTGSLIGVLFPSCECGIVPISHQFIRKGIPPHTAFAFMLTAPIINPIVIFSTYIAFSNSWTFPLLRVAGSLLVSIVVGTWMAYFYKDDIIKDLPEEAHAAEHQHTDAKNAAAVLAFAADKAHLEDASKAPVQPAAAISTALPSKTKSFFDSLWESLEHAVEEFFDTGRYLIFGALVASAMQVYLKTSLLLQMGSTKLTSILVLLLLACILSLCSEADAFIGSSLLGLFGPASITAFLVFGPMVDIKNLLMMSHHFKGKFIVRLIGLIIVTVVAYTIWI